MFDWLLGLINKRQAALYAENLKLQKEVKNLYKASFALGQSSVIAVELLQRQQRLNRQGHVYTPEQLEVAEEAVRVAAQKQGLGLLYLPEFKLEDYTD